MAKKNINAIKKAKSDYVLEWITGIILTLAFIVVAYPIIYVISASLSSSKALENGLVVPNIPNADKKGLAQISAELKELSEAARSGSLSGDKLTGGTFTITNLGMYGIESFSPIINQPEVAILGVNAMEEKVIVRKGEQVVRLMMTLSLTADHRAVDGAVAAQFLHRVKTLLENPALMLA